MKRVLAALASLVVALPLALATTVGPADAAAHRWTKADYRCTSLATGVRLCANKQKSVYAGHTHYRSRLSVAPAAGHWAAPRKLIQRNLTSQRIRNVCGHTLCPHATKRVVGRWFDSGTTAMVDGWTVATDSGTMTLAIGNTAPVGTAAARATIHCLTTSSGRVCNRMDVMLTGAGVRIKSYAVVTPATDRAVTFLGWTLEAGSATTSDQGCGHRYLCPVYEKKGSYVIGVAAYPIDWPTSTSFTDADRTPVTTRLTVGTSKGDALVDTRWAPKG